MDQIRTSISEQRTFADRTRQCVCEVSLDFFARRDPATAEISELRLHQSKRIISQLTDAFAGAAPWYARIGMQMND